MQRSHARGPDAAQTQARLRGGTFTMMILDVPANGDPLAGLAKKLSQAPSFFESAPVVLDLDGIDDGAALDLSDLVARLRELKLVPVGVQNGGDGQNAAALQVGLCPFPSWRSGRSRPSRHHGGESQLAQDQPPPRTAPAHNDGERGETASGRPAEQPGRAAEILTQPVRSGRRVHAQGDLVALAPVSAGAELIADGHIHVYGPLRGRALAGVRGDDTARIFCQSLEAELVSISGAYLVREDIEDSVIGHAVQIQLDGDRVTVTPLPRANRGA